LPLPSAVYVAQPRTSVTASPGLNPVADGLSVTFREPPLEPTLVYTLTTLPLRMAMVWLSL
jgi:hypothetical protein